MAVITMRQTSSALQPLLKRLITDFPAYTFSEGASFSWSPDTQTIHYPLATSDLASLLHELAHAELHHKDYRYDIELLRLESAAWNYVQEILAPHYAITISTSFVQECMEEYREWLYRRSLCPTCDQTGIQDQKKTYSCINCRSSWRVNDARTCAIRRIKLRGQS